MAAALTAATAVMSVSATLLVRGGWLVWLPVVPALLMVAAASRRVRDRP